MGQSASSNNHAENTPLRETLLVPRLASSNDDHGTQHTMNTDENGTARRVQRRRRSRSPDVDTADLSRSGRLRRRLSRLVPGSLSSTSSQVTGRYNHQSTGEDNSQPRPETSDIDITSQRTLPEPTSLHQLSANQAQQRFAVQPAASRLSNLGHVSSRPYSTSASILRPAPLLRGRPNSVSDVSNPNIPAWLREDRRQIPLPTVSPHLDGHDQNRSRMQHLTGLGSGSGHEERPSRLMRMRNSITATSIPNSPPVSSYISPDSPSESNAIAVDNNIETQTEWDNERLGRPTLGRNFSDQSLANLDYDSDLDASLNSTDASLRSPLERSLSEFGTLDTSDSPTRARPGEDQAAVLSRLLSVAAAATAASLVGSSDQALTEAQDVAGDSVDGSFESFLRALQNGRLAAALRNGGNELGERMHEQEPGDSASNEGSIAPLNFFRMFRFGSGTQNAATANSNTEPTERMIPVIIVGIRSVTPHDGLVRDGRPTPPFFDALANLPATVSGGSSNTSRSLPRPFAARRTENAGRTIVSDSMPESQTLNTSHMDDLQMSSPNNSATGRTLPSTIATPQVPEGPSYRRSFSPSSFPPLPSLFSSIRSRTNSVGTIASSTDIADRNTLPENPGMGSQTRGTWSESVGDSQQTIPSSERRSDRTRNAQSPDPLRSPSEGTRSWIIYVLGGSYPENHPILTTPSLFTDTPTYEDMMLLSSLLGPAKPPVATQDDIESAGGILEVFMNDEDSIPSNLNSSNCIEVQLGDRCLVCLSDFEKGDKCRQLIKCQHLFHRDCIDKWLTTGRNSCPLCRGKGVEELMSKVETSTQDPQLADNEASIPAI